MKTNQISEDLEIGNNLPDDCPYFERFLPRKARQGKRLLLGDKLTLISNDRAFGWNLPCCYFEARRPMPAWLCRHVAFRVYIYLDNRATIADHDLARAYAVQQCPRQRDLWRAFLVTEASFDQIAALLNERVQVIRLFCQLFWNVRPWLKDGTYMTDLLHMNTLGPVDPALELMRLGYDEGALRLARRVGLAQDASSPESMAEQYERLERRVVSRANTAMDYGLYDAKANPALRAAQTLLLANRRAEQQKEGGTWDDKMGFGRMSADKSIQLVIKQMTQQSAMEKLRAAQEYNSKQATEAAKKALDNGST